VNSNTLPKRTSDPIDPTGGEPLAGSGFEAEEPDGRFGSDVTEAAEA
jgi:hypothetical protein